jgi:hypothetical protein
MGKEPSQQELELDAVILPVSGQALRDLQPLLRSAYHSGQGIAGEIVRDHTGVYLRAHLFDRKAHAKLMRILNPKQKPIR